VRHDHLQSGVVGLHIGLRRREVRRARPDSRPREVHGDIGGALVPRRAEPFTDGSLGDTDFLGDLPGAKAIAREPENLRLQGWLLSAGNGRLVMVFIHGSLSFVVGGW